LINVPLWGDLIVIARWGGGGAISIVPEAAPQVLSRYLFYFSDLINIPGAFLLILPLLPFGGAH
jgi:hypothetical protein